MDDVLVRAPMTTVIWQMAELWWPGRGRFTSAGIAGAPDFPMHSLPPCRAKMMIV